MIDIRNVNKYYEKGKSNQVHAVKNANLTLPDHGIVAIFGKSGCGKTTLLNIIGGLDSAQTGEVRIDGEKITPNTDRARNHAVGYIFQNYNLIKTMSVYDNVATSLRLCGITDEELIRTRTLAALSGVEMEKYKNRLPDSLSGGQQQRVAIARALVKNPRLILADEPTGNLDEQNTVMVMDLLHEIAKEHLVLLVTHEAELVDLYCDMVIEVTDGAITDQRTNEVTVGWQGKRKTDIYLGDLSHTVAVGEHLQVDYYGEEAQAPQGLRLISVGNTLYLQAPPEVKIRMLDSTAELKVHEGSYQPTAPRKAAALDPALHQPLPMGKRAGRMFRFKDAIVTGFRRNFSGAKKGRKLLITGLFCFALVFVLMVSYFGHSFSDYLDAKEKFNSQNLYLSAELINDRAALDALLDKGRVDSVRLVSGHAQLKENGLSYLRMEDPIEWVFGIGNFESTNSDWMFFIEKASTLQVDAAKEHTLLYGKKEVQGKELLLSSAFADMLLEVTGVSYIDSYEDLLYLECYYNYSQNDLNTYTVVGIVEDSDANVYLSRQEMTRLSLVAVGTMFSANGQNQFGIPTSEQLEQYKLTPLQPGEIYLRGGMIDLSFKGAAKGETGEKVLIGGKEYVIKQALQLNFGSPEEYLAQQKVFTSYWQAKEAELKKNLPYLADREAYEEFIKGYGDKFTDDAFYAKDFLWNQFYDLQNMYPDGNDPQLEIYMVYMNQLEMEYSQWWDQQVQDYYDQVNAMQNKYHELPIVLMNEADYLGLALDIAIYDDQNENTLFQMRTEEDEKSDMYYGYYRDVYFALHAEDLNGLLAATQGMGDVQSKITPEDLLDYYKQDFEEEIMISVIFLAIFGALMAFCLYFIMRSGMMSAIREIGIYRAIGAGRRNLVFRYFVETLVVFALTILIGFACSSAALWWLLSKTQMLSTVIFYPVWMGGIVLAVLFAISVVCGLLPILTLLRKTPAQILAKYDI